VKTNFKIVHVITCLDNGGAESLLYKFIQYNNHDRHYVISLRGEGKYGSKIRALGVNVDCLDMSPKLPSLFAVAKMLVIIVRQKPDVVKTWMYHANLLGGLAALLCGYPVIWGIHNTTLDKSKSSVSTRIINWICGKCSNLVPSVIISVSEIGLPIHRAAGYNINKMMFIPNGYDVDSYCPSPLGRKNIRLELAVADNIRLLGLVARFNPQKDHENLLSSLSLVNKNNRHVRLLLVGPQIDRNNRPLVEKIHENGLDDCVMLLGPRDDIPAIMNAIDLFVLPSAFGEAFPNVLAEAMACGTPCVTTCVGDSSSIVGNTGWVVEPRNPIVLAEAITNALQEMDDCELWKKRQSLCRQRIVNNFTIGKFVDRYRDLIAQLAR
jgi:glycosyltransferase involved in cell wall biosynthesis